ncbi:MAG: 3-deoxy-manno-octulosonate cytidylyltransferase [Acidobacteriota bacterium]|nr:MAG: 3-deoxy-manno-octulosonate cytidylyltransferase [Acidobacteriota bacterium]
MTQKEVVAIIPARISSERLPGKLLLEAGGKPLIVHTLEAVRGSERVSRVIVAVDDSKLMNAVSEAGGEAVMTSTSHRSGSDRIAEVASVLEGDPIIVNVQGDEPMISHLVIDAAVDALIADAMADIATTCEPIIDAGDVLSPDVVKVVTDGSGRALYFSRSPIPYPRDAVRLHGSLEAALDSDPGLCAGFRKHTGLYVFRKHALMKFTGLEPAASEIAERLEQLRAIENGMIIKVVEVTESSIGIDTEADLERFREMLEAREAERASA